ncbi:hypothetical protein D3C76_1601840 [compost metagenome]
MPVMAFSVGLASTYALSKASTCCGSVWLTSAWKAKAVEEKCQCDSTKPGSTSLPPASSSRVAGPACAMTLAWSPTQTMRSPQMATAWAQGLCGSTV